MLEHPFPRGTRVRILSYGKYKLSSPDGIVRWADARGSYHIIPLGEAQEKTLFGWQPTTSLQVPADQVVPLNP
jgi:hypothetical protein